MLDLCLLGGQVLQPVVSPQLLLPPEELVAHLAPRTLVLVEVAELDVPLAVGPVRGSMKLITLYNL